MPVEQEVATITEAVGVFHQAEDLQSAIDELLSSGFHRSELGLLADASAVEKKLGHRIRNTNALADDAAAPRSAYVSPEAIGDAQGGLIGGLVYVGAAVAAGVAVASGGTLAVIITAVVLAGGTGGLLGSVLARWLGDHHARYIQEQIERGGLLLWVHTRTSSNEERAVDILKKHSAGQVHVHRLRADALESAFERLRRTDRL
jgi:hypothetical protein